MTRTEIVELVKRGQEAFARHDVASLTALHSDSCVVESPLGGTQQGKAAIGQVYRAFFEAFPDASYSVSELVIDDDVVVQVGTLSGTDTGGFMGMVPSGKPAVFPMVVVYRVADGLIVSERRIYDFTGMLVQIGVLKAKPA